MKCWTIELVSYKTKTELICQRSFSSVCSLVLSSPRRLDNTKKKECWQTSEDCVDTSEELRRKEISCCCSSVVVNDNQEHHVVEGLGVVLPAMTDQSNTGADGSGTFQTWSRTVLNGVNTEYLIVQPSHHRGKVKTQGVENYWCYAPIYSSDWKQKLILMTWTF